MSLQLKSYFSLSLVGPQIVRTFSFKGMTNKLFGQEAPEQREARLKLLEELIAEGEESVKEKTAECE